VGEWVGSGIMLENRLTLAKYQKLL